MILTRMKETAIVDVGCIGAHWVVQLFSLSEGRSILLAPGFVCSISTLLVFCLPFADLWSHTSAILRSCLPSLFGFYASSSCVVLRHIRPIVCHYHGNAHSNNTAPGKLAVVCFLVLLLDYLLCDSTIHFRW